jgi:hypothetical protein
VVAAPQLLRPTDSTRTQRTTLPTVAVRKPFGGAVVDDGKPWLPWWSLFTPTSIVRPRGHDH